jgi:hypothetical protein
VTERNDSRNICIAVERRTSEIKRKMWRRGVLIKLVWRRDRVGHVLGFPGLHIVSCVSRKILGCPTILSARESRAHATECAHTSDDVICVAHTHTFPFCLTPQEVPSVENFDGYKKKNCYIWQTACDICWQVIWTTEPRNISRELLLNICSSQAVLSTCYLFAHKRRTTLKAWNGGLPQYELYLGTS